MGLPNNQLPNLVYIGYYYIVVNNFYNLNCITYRLLILDVMLSMVNCFSHVMYSNVECGLNCRESLTKTSAMKSCVNFATKPGATKTPQTQTELGCSCSIACLSSSHLKSSTSICSSEWLLLIVDLYLLLYTASIKLLRSVLCPVIIKLYRLYIRD